MAEAAPHVALAAMPMSGHMGPIMTLAVALSRGGCRVTVFCSSRFLAKFSKASAAGGLDFVGVEDGIDDRIVETAAADCQAGGGPKIFRDALDMGRSPSSAAVAEVHARNKIDFGICDFVSFAYHSAFLASDIDFGVSMPMPAATSSVFVLGGPKPPCVERMVVSMIKSKVASFMPAIKDINFMMNTSNAMTQSSHAFVHSWAPLDDTANFPSHVHFLGALGDSEEQLSEECQGFIDREENKIVYVSMGSIVVLSAAQIQTIYNGLQQLGVSVIWSLKEGLQVHLPEGALTNARFFIRSWLQQPLILKHDKVHYAVLHGGWSGLIEAAAGGCATCFLPFFADQPQNAQFAQMGGWAVQIQPQKMTASGLQTAVEKLMRDGKFLQRAREIAAGSRQVQDPVEVIRRIAADTASRGRQRGTRAPREEEVEPSTAM
eukprot:TRINITY_DN52438_c0_g1_i2.p1 TRINITY_DN52438_c0_g1~~TRINITY_DN52438_c0_g1_i2.p1  ORF type:complete len:433 (+),score=70.03 TRINITY_DN52438_c0_g1_i2:71-1369(+)